MRAAWFTVGVYTGAVLAFWLLTRVLAGHP
jgi:hypothetical protein